MKKISRDELMLREGVMRHLVIEALSDALKHDELEEFMKEVDYYNKKELECYLVFEGKQLPIQAVCKHWESQMDEQIKKKALELLEEKLREYEDFASELSKEIKRKAAKKLGIELEKEW